MSRRRRRNPNNTLLYVGIGAAVLGVGYLLLKKSPTGAPAAGATPGNISITTGQAQNPLASLLGTGVSVGKGLFGGNSSSNGNSDATPNYDPTTDPNYDPTSDPTDPGDG